MIIKFIAHAGFAIQEDGFTLVIDPWFRDSTPEDPLIEGINRKQTIEFQIPPAKDKIEDYSPNCILLSHFHVHHSPFRDVRGLVENALGDVLFAYPNGYANKIVENRFGDLKYVTLRPTDNGESFVVGPFTISALSHTVQGHLAWSIKSKTGHLLHIADGAANTDFDVNALHQVWDKFDDIKPDLVCMSAGRNSLRIEKEGQKEILESGCFSPIQAARLIKKIKPKAVSPIGNHNHSFKKNRLEFIPDTYLNEEEMRWALSWLSSETKFIPVRPGHTFSLGESFDQNNIADSYF